MNKIDDILDRLQGQMPELEHPDEMMENIMQNLPDREMFLSDRETKPQGWLVALRVIASAAAIWLIGLFVYVNWPQQSATQNVNAYIIDFPQSSTLENVYTRCMRKSQSKPISYTRLKQMIYAKK